jgi:hypothetical protein
VDNSPEGDGAIREDDMNTMIERVIDAIQDTIDISESGGVNFEKIARAAIEAMREPTPEMVDAMRLANMNIAGGYDGPSGWEAAIDAALKD